MEHLPTRTGFSKSIFPPIPYLCKDKYDGGPFLEYPRRLGLPNFETVGTPPNPPLSLGHRRFLAAMPPAELELFLQTWLFFGLLQEVLGGLYHYEDFVTMISDGEGERTVVTTSVLVLRLEEWEATIEKDQGQRMAVYERVAKCLKLTYACLKVEYHALDNDIKFHLASVAEILGYALSKACDVAWEDSPSRSLMPIYWGNVISEDFRVSILLERSSCCPSQMPMLIQEFGSPQALSFVASCFHDDIERLQHASCNGIICRAGDLKGHITRHVSEACGCEFIHVDEDLLTDCLKTGSLPLLRLKEEPNLNGIAIEVVASTDSISYVALSHVWADGLGNPRATALPRCQLLRLKALIDQLDTDITQDHPEGASEILLWCDTLCCPVKSPEGKNMALAQMYRTYDEASKVVVLDRSLISRRVGGMRVDEACLRIAASRWMTRLWTLQEGALPDRNNKLWFQFTKTALHVRTLYEHIWKVSHTDIRRRAVAEGIIQRFLTFMTLFDVTDSERSGANLRDIMEGLKYRSVTVPSDEPLIIANLMALDLSAILASEPTERMNTLWKTLGASPVGIRRQILFHLGPKMHEPGLRWAPQSLLSIDRHFAVPIRAEECEWGFLATNHNDRGLLVEFAGIRISIADPAKGLPKQLSGFGSLPKKDINRNSLLTRDPEGRWYLLKHRLYGEPDCPTDLEEMCTVVSRLSSPWILYCGSSSPPHETTKAHLGLLVTEQHSSDDYTCAELHSHVCFGRVPTEVDQSCEAAYCFAQELASTPAASRLGEFEIGLKDPDDPVYQETLQALDLELQRLSKSSRALETLTNSGNSADERGSASICEYTERVYRGLYLRIEEFAPANRKWCVD